MHMAEPTSASSPNTGAVNYFSINHLLQQSQFPSPESDSKNDEENPGTSSKQIPPPERELETVIVAASSSETSLATSDSDRLLATLQTSGTCVQPHFSLSLNPTTATIDLLKQPDSFVDRKSDSDSIATSHFDEKSVRETTIPLWLNCAAATAAVLPFEQSFLMAQRSG